MKTLKRKTATRTVQPASHLDISSREMAYDRRDDAHAAGNSRVRHGYAKQWALTSLPLFVADLLTVLFATLVVFDTALLMQVRSVTAPFKLLAFVAVTLPIVYSLFRLYPGTGLNPIMEFRQSMIATIIVFAAFIVASLIHDGRQGYPLLVMFACALSMVLIPIVRSAVRRLCSRFDWWGQPLLILGGHDTGWHKHHYFRSRPYLGLRPVGVVDDLDEESQFRYGKRPEYLGALKNAPQLAEQHDVYWAVVAMPSRSPAEVCQIIDRHAGNIPHLLVLADAGGLPSLWNHACDCAGQLGIQLQSSLLLPLPRIIKRLIDLTIVITGGVFCLPLIACIAAVVKASSPGRVFYRQERIGHGGRRFSVVKFRTMVQNAEKVLDSYFEEHPDMREEWERDSKLKNDPRITPIGRWLRKTSLDELPQIWNVLVGEMSLVGPRPIMMCEFEKYSMNRQGFMLYSKVLPGITGLWQISGRSDTTYAERMDLDSYYVRNWSPWMDLFILFRTVKVVLFQSGAY